LLVINLIQFCDSQFIANTHGCRWGNDCAGDSGCETGNVHACLLITGVTVNLS